MEITVLENDIEVLTLKASSFPEGVLEAHKTLHQCVSSTNNRRYFGLSRPEQGTIIYRAAAEVLGQDEPKKFGLETLTILKGNYTSISISNFMDDVSRIGKAFTDLLQRRDLDSEGYCIEWYLNDKEVKCMVRLKE
jgi:hypothetical protein